MTQLFSAHIDRPHSIVSAATPHNAAAQAVMAQIKANRRVRSVVVLLGGPSAEREVSLESAANAVCALETSGYAVRTLDMSRDLGTLARVLQQETPQVVFNALHGRYGEDGCVQGLLNILGIPYTHSGLVASALALDKPMARRLFIQGGLRVPPGKVCTREDLMAADPLPRPYVVKPLNEGSSVGVVLVRAPDDAPYFATREWPYGPQVLVESYIPGREFTCAVMESHAFGVTEIKTKHTFYDYDAKYAVGESVHILPAEIDADLYADCQRLAICAHQTLGCRGLSRTDMRYDGESLYVLEINTQPGMTRTSLVPEQGDLAGISFPDLCTWMVETAKCDD